MSPLTVYIVGYVITAVVLLAIYGYEQEETGGAPCMSEQIWFWFLSVMVSFLWPLVWSYYIPVLLGVLIRKLVEKRAG